MLRQNNTTENKEENNDENTLESKVYDTTSLYDSDTSEKDEQDLSKITYSFPWSDEDTLPEHHPRLVYNLPSDISDEDEDIEYKNDTPAHNAASLTAPNTPQRTVKMYQEDPLTEEKLSSEVQTDRDLFTALVKGIYDHDYPGYLDYLKDPTYKPHQLVIYQALQKIRGATQDHAVKIAAVFFARENAMHIAKAICILEKANIDFNTKSGILQKTYQDLIALGKDADTVTRYITQYSERGERTRMSLTENLHIYLGQFLKLKQAGVSLSNKMCLILLKSAPLNRPSFINALIELHNASRLTDYFYMGLAFFDKIHYLREIADLILFLKDKIPLTEEIISRLIKNGSSAHEVLNRINASPESTPDFLNTLLNNMHETKELTFSQGSETVSISGNISPIPLRLIPPISQLLTGADSPNKKREIEECVAALQNNELLTDYLLANFVLYQEHFNLILLTHLLIKIKVELSLQITNEFIDIIFEDISKVQWFMWIIDKFRNDEIHTTIEDLMIIFKLETGYIEAISTSYSIHHLLPKTIPQHPAEIKLSDLSLASIKNILQSREAVEVCNILLKYPHELMLLHDSILSCTVTRNVFDIPAILELFFSLASDMPLCEETIQAICIAILKGNENDCIHQLHQTEKQRVMQHIKDNHLLPLPTVLSNCIFGYFYSPPTMKTKQPKIEVVKNEVLASELSEQKSVSRP